MPGVHTHYDNLKVTRDAPPEVIRAAYRALCQKFHPDRHKDDSVAIRNMQLINKAYEVLSDPEQRKTHDEWILATEQAELEEKNKSANQFIRKAQEFAKTAKTVGTHEKSYKKADERKKVHKHKKSALAYKLQFPHIFVGTLIALMVILGAFTFSH
jgi:DnaJ-class molecular chaperone